MVSWLHAKAPGTDSFPGSAAQSYSRNAVRPARILPAMFFPVWQIRFALPVRQLLLMTALTALTSAAATAASWYLIKRRDFLTEIRNII